MYVIRRGVWADRTAHIVASRERIERPDGENVGDRVFVLCSAVPFYWWDGYSDTTQKADILCPECHRLSKIKEA